MTITPEEFIGILKLVGPVVVGWVGSEVRHKAKARRLVDPERITERRLEMQDIRHLLQNLTRDLKKNTDETAAVRKELSSLSRDFYEFRGEVRVNRENHNGRG